LESELLLELEPSAESSSFSTGFVSPALMSIANLNSFQHSAQTDFCKIF
jgi:hypothetical protein